MPKIKVKLVVNDWYDPKNNELAKPGEYIELSSGALHSGTAFYATIELSEDDILDIDDGAKKGFQPLFYLVKEN